MKVTKEMVAKQAARARAEMQRVRAGKHLFKVNGPAGAVTVKVTAKPWPPKPKDYTITQTSLSHFVVRRKDGSYVGDALTQRAARRMADYDMKKVARDLRAQYRQAYPGMIL